MDVTQVPCSSSSPFLCYDNTSKLLPLEISPLLQTSSRIIETLERPPLHPIPPPLPSKPFENPHQRQLLATTESKLWDPNEVKLFAFYFQERVPFCMLCLQTQQDDDRFVGIPPPENYRSPDLCTGGRALRAVIWCKQLAFIDFESVCGVGINPATGYI